MRIALHSGSGDPGSNPGARFSKIPKSHGKVLNLTELFYSYILNMN